MSGQHRHLAHHRRERPDRVRQPGLQWRQGQRPLLERRAAITFGATNIIAGNYLAGTHIDFGTTVPATGSGSGRVLAVTDYVAFDRSGTMDKLGTGEDLTGGLDIGGNLSGYVLLSSDAAYTQGVSSVVLTPGQLYNTSNVTIGGGSADALLVPATLTVFNTLATLTGTNTYSGATRITGGTVQHSAAGGISRLQGQWSAALFIGF